MTRADEIWFLIDGLIWAGVLAFWISFEMRARRDRNRHADRQAAIDRMHARGCICLWEGNQAFIDANCPHFEAHMRVAREAGAPIERKNGLSSIN